MHGVVASCSYAARRFGIRSAMPMARAVHLCPPLIIVPSRHDAYSAVSKQVMAKLHQLTPLVEQLSIDEAFLDVTDLPDNGEAIARRLQAGIRAQLKLPCSLGVAGNKLVAKIANNVGKASARGNDTPQAITVVPPGQEASYQAPLPVTELWGVGPKTAESLAKLGLQTIGDIARWPEGDLAHRARGIDERSVEPEADNNGVPPVGVETQSPLNRFSHWLFKETDGQPLFLTETLKALVEDGLVRPATTSMACR